MDVQLCAVGTVSNWEMNFIFPVFIICVSSQSGGAYCKSLCNHSEKLKWFFTKALFDSSQKTHSNIIAHKKLVA